MHKFLNFILVVSVLISGFVLYSHEHATRDLERQIASYKRDIAEETENLRLLNAEWSSLTRPDRIRALAAQYLGLSTLKAQQIVKMSDIVHKVPPEPVMKLEAEGSDPIGAIIDKMQQ